MLRADFHVHTKFSADSMFSIPNLIKTCQKMRINCVAIMDHNSIEGALQVRDTAPFKVIIGEEIRALEGEVCGLFLTENVPPDLPLEQTFKIIKDQGGLVYLPHPFSFFRREAISREKLYKLYEQVDIVEAYNGRNFLAFENGRAVRFAMEKGIPAGAGSDAHHNSEIGNIYVEMEDFSSKEELLANLKKGKIFLAPYSRRIGSFMIEASLFLSWIKIVNFFRGERT